MWANSDEEYCRTQHLILDHSLLIVIAQSKGISTFFKGVTIFVLKTALHTSNDGLIIVFFIIILDYSDCLHLLVFGKKIYPSGCYLLHTGLVNEQRSQ